MEIGSYYDINSKKLGKIVCREEMLTEGEWYRERNK